MKKLIILILSSVLISLGIPAFASSPGNSHSNQTGQGHANHQGQGVGHNKTTQSTSTKPKNLKVKNIITNTNNNTNRNVNNNSLRSNISNIRNSSIKSTNTQEQSAKANNEGIIVKGSSYEDNNTFITPPSTTPMFGTVSAQVTTPFGGAGFSKDAKYAKLMSTIQFINYMKNEKLLKEERAISDAEKVYEKLLKTVCGRSCTKNKIKDDDLTNGNGGNL